MIDPLLSRIRSDLSRLPNNVRPLVVRTKLNDGEPSKERIRAVAYDGQGKFSGLNVECSTKMREQLGAGRLLIMYGRLTCKRGGADSVYTYHGWPVIELNGEDPAEVIARL